MGESGDEWCAYAFADQIGKATSACNDIDFCRRSLPCHRNELRRFIIMFISWPYRSSY